MKYFARTPAWLVAGLALSASLIPITGCKSYWIDAEVQNRTGKTLHEVEVDYPTASFGINSLDPGGSMHYRLQIRGSGPVKVEYTFENGTASKAQGLDLKEHQQGHLTIRILPGGKVDFIPDLEPRS